MLQEKISDGYMKQYFDKDGKFVRQEFVACGECHGARDCYAPFNPETITNAGCGSCDSCYHCITCKDCVLCIECNDCVDCQECKYCTNCTECTSCESCHFCTDCYGLKGKHGWQNNEPPNHNLSWAELSALIGCADWVKKTPSDWIQFLKEIFWYMNEH